MKEIQNTLKLLRFHFSIFLLPVSLFSFFYIQPDLEARFLLVVLIWHLLVFPASNGYNSYNDRDEGPIGGLLRPPMPTRTLLVTVNMMDLLAIFLSVLVNWLFSLFVLAYILVSRLYSNRSIRLKQYPVIGFLVVFIFQGMWIFCGNVVALATPELLTYTPVFLSAVASSFLAGTLYPLTQIYQHQSDHEDGVNTLSMVLGMKGTFVFSVIMFAIASILIYCSFYLQRAVGNFWLFNLVMLPSTLYFFSWAFRSFKDTVHVNFRNTMIMLVLSSTLNNIYFLVLLFT